MTQHLLCATKSAKPGLARRRSFRRTRLAAGTLAATATFAAFGAAASASVPPDGSSATDDALDLVVNGQALSEGAPVRFDMTVELIGLPFDFGDGPLATGSTDGTNTEIGMDLNAIFESVPGGLPDEFKDADLTLNMLVVDGELFVSGGMFALIGELDPEFDQFAELGDGWGVVRNDGSAEVDAIFSELTGAGANPTDVADLLDFAAGAEITGTTEIDGEEMTVVTVEVPASSLADVTEDNGTLADAGETPVPIEVAYDAAGFPRQVTISLTNEVLETAAAADGTDLDSLGVGLDTEMNLTLSFYDYNDESIVFEAPADAIDVTDDFIAMTEQS